MMDMGGYEFSVGFIKPPVQSNREAKVAGIGTFVRVKNFDF